MPAEQTDGGLPIRGIAESRPFDLAEYFLSRVGNLSAEKLLEHPALDPKGLGSGGEKGAGFVALVALLNQRHRAVDAWRSRRMADMRSMVEAGVVDPIEESPPNERECRALAKAHSMRGACGGNGPG